MTTRTEIDKKVNRRYNDVYLKRRFPNGTYDTDWIDVTRYVSSIDWISYSLDYDSAYDVGISTVDNVGITFDNKDGKFNDFEDPRSYWNSIETRNKSQVKIEAGYIDSNDDKIEQIVFTGFWDELRTKVNLNDTVKTQLLAKISILRQLDIDVGTFNNEVMASDFIYAALNRPEITDFLTLDESNIDVDFDYLIDEPYNYGSKKLDKTINEILFFANSVLYVDSSDNIIVRSRATKRVVSYKFYSNSSTGNSDNIHNVMMFSTGRSRLRNSFSWGSSTINARSDSVYLEKYGISTKVIFTDTVTTDATIKSILANLLTEWQFPKKEITIQTDYLANEISLLDLVTVDLKPNYKNTNDIPTYNQIQWDGSYKYASYGNGINVNALLGFKVVKIIHDITNSKTVLTLREKGNQLNDGYITMMGNQSYSVTFSAETTKDVDVSSEGFDARYCGVEVLDTSTNYQTDEITVSRPNSDTIRLTAGVAISKTFRVLVWEIENV